jgi:putative membrane protein
MGIYAPTLEAVRGLNLPYVLTFMAGAVIGLGSFARLLEWLLVHRHSMTMAALTGLMIGGVRALWPWQTEDRTVLAPPDVVSALVMAALAAIGFVAVLLLIRAGASRVGRPVAPEAVTPEPVAADRG